MANVQSFFSGFLYLGVLLLHLGCCLFISSSCLKPRPEPGIGKKRKATVTVSPPKDQKPFTFTPWSYLKSVFSIKVRKKNEIHDQPTSGFATGQAIHPTTSPGSSSRSSHQSAISIQTSSSMVGLNSPRKRISGSCRESPLTMDPQSIDSVSFRNSIFPCSICGEIFTKVQLLEQHQAIKHAVSELIEGDSGKNIVRIIFQSSWIKKEKNPSVQRILKIHNSPKIHDRFEQHRETVKSIAARTVNRRNERCVVDGNELLRFHCCTFTCSLGLNSSSRLCNQQFCSVCGIIRAGFSAKLDGISTWASSWRAHESISEDMEEEFAFMNLKRAMLVCRVIAGRVAYDHEEQLASQNESFDSVAGQSLEELLVFNPKAVLPCFVIVYQM